MVQKPIAISVIAPLSVAAILTLAVLAGISLTNQAFAQAKKSTSLSIGAFPCCQRSNVDGDIAAHVSFSGKLTSEGSEGPGGATIQLLGLYDVFGTTDKYGSYSVSVDLVPGTYHIYANYGGDSDHEPSHSNIITYKVTY